MTSSGNASFLSSKRSSGQKVPFICIGAQKSGTTWLHEALIKHPDIWLPPIKELHYFNEKYVPEGHYRLRLRHLIKHAEAYLSDLETREPYRPYAPGMSTYYKQLRWHCEFFTIQTDEEYRDYLVQNSGNAKVFGEITPEYALLPLEGFVNIQKLLPGVRILYLLRDPIERLWSQLRMKAKNDGKSAAELAGEIGKLPLRSDYKTTIENVTGAEIEHFKVMLYEDLFSEGSLQEILSFLGLDTDIPEAMRAMLGKVVHQGEKSDAPDLFIQRARAILAPIYDYAEKDLGLNISGKWRHANAHAL